MKKTLYKRLFSKLFNNRISIITIIVISVGLFCSLLWTGSYFSINKIEFISDPPLSQVRGTENFYHQNILYTDVTAIEKSIVENNAMVQSAQVVKKYPQKIVVTLKFYEPVALLAVNNGYFVLASNGRILQKQTNLNPQLPTIDFYQKLIYETYTAGDMLDFKEILAALHFLNTASSVGLHVKHIDIDGLHMIRLQIDEKEVWFTTDKDPEVQDYQLVTLVKQFKIEGKDFVKLDLRFDKPVLTIKK